MGDENSVNQTTTGVNPGETATPTSQPGSDQTTQTSDSTPNPAPESTMDEEKSTIPYSRFKEVNEKAKKADTYEVKLKEYEARIRELETPKSPENPQLEAAKNIIRNLGFVSKEEIEERERRSREDTAVQQELSKLEGKYDGSNGLPKFDRRKVVEFAIDRKIADPEVAYKTLFEKEYLDWHIQKAISNSKGIKTEGSDGSGAKPTGDSKSDLEAAAARGDDDAFSTLLKRTNLHQKFFKK